ncbi:hypothetical protein LTR37_007633 [Vermiconidia calcicola]|uniref:Uncharacterized protein n=1 Tax=Vermiconidia calcicola TaxID=1690605 RepID=A0ACC3NCQ5_9PEZI|nr:hypothetical protein LTR37_007633 [Vermiconidia calcicola]
MPSKASAVASWVSTQSRRLFERLVLEKAPPKAFSETVASNEAARHVFSTYELAECIFLPLPMEDLVAAAKVCRNWHTVMETSAQFRQRLVDLSIIDLMIATKLCKS